MDTIKELSLEHIADMVEKGFVEGNLSGQEPEFDGWWSINIQEDDEEEHVRLEQIAIWLREGKIIGFDPTYQLRAKVWNEDSPERFDESKKNDDPTKKEMINFLKKKYEGLLDPEEVEANEFDMEEAIYWFAHDYHGGQWSNLYSVLSTSDYNPSRSHNSIKDTNSEVAIDMYKDLEDKFIK